MSSRFRAAFRSSAVLCRKRVQRYDLFSNRQNFFLRHIPQRAETIFHTGCYGTKFFFIFLKNRAACSVFSPFPHRFFAKFDTLTTTETHISLQRTDTQSHNVVYLFEGIRALHVHLTNL